MRQMCTDKNANLERIKNHLIDQSILQLKLRQLTLESRQFLNDDDQVISYLELEGE